MEQKGLSLDVDVGSTRSVQKIVMLIIVEKKDFVLLVSDLSIFIMFSSVTFSYFLSTTYTVV